MSRQKNWQLFLKRSDSFSDCGLRPVWAYAPEGWQNGECSIYFRISDFKFQVS